MAHRSAKVYTTRKEEARRPRDGWMMNISDAVAEKEPGKNRVRI
jgi:hypothetical protein